MVYVCTKNELADAIAESPFFNEESLALAYSRLESISRQATELTKNLPGGDINTDRVIRVSRALINVLADEEGITSAEVNALVTNFLAMMYSGASNYVALQTFYTGIKGDEMLVQTLLVGHLFNQTLVGKNIVMSPDLRRELGSI